ncbi:helix-turn-helix domain-containing protein [Streptomyces fuscichromogenes]|uniref:Transcriptional regulator n=1 Tax=Streptomyces fuscichromogenes TaxID=1324013 RepID=A0A918CU90_9ACTN|nr:helix-turn-helix transcriptional regulator [Streptomyces fuscichromogenes]GGN26717.1 transcriptional regulator [Streptomyces fuscichromogenes]
MAGPKDLDPSSSPRALLGAELRHARERKGLSQAELGQLVFVSGSFIGQLEAGTRRMQPEVARMLDEVLAAGGFFTRHCGVGATSKYPAFFVDVAELEAEATAIRQYTPLLVPGLLQTPAYAWAVNRAYDPTTPAETIKEWTQGRMDRTRLLDHPTKPLLWMVLDEAALRRAAGGRGVMAEALRHIADLSRRNRAIVQVLPLSAGAHAGMAGALKLMEFEDAPPLAYLEAVRSGRLEDDPATVTQLRFVFDLLVASALSQEKSLALIEALAEDYTHEQNP